MAKLQLCCIAGVFVLGFIMITCTASTVYTVGDTSGWDISSDLDSWVQQKTFQVGDALLFQYSSYHSVSEASKESYDRCYVTNFMSRSSDGNTTIPLTNPGEKYFFCGNKLHCLGGMKIHVTVIENQANSPAGAPKASPKSSVSGGGSSSLPNPSPKKNNRPIDSAGVVHGGKDSLFYVFLCGIIATVFSVAVV